jgi:hypothetical protein
VIRYTIAHYYLAFGIIQLIFLAIVMEQFDTFVSNLTSAVVNVLIGKRVFANISNSFYNLALS